MFSLNIPPSCYLFILQLSILNCINIIPHSLLFLFSTYSFLTALHADFIPVFKDVAPGSVSLSHSALLFSDHIDTRFLPMLCLIVHSCLPLCSISDAHRYQHLETCHHFFFVMPLEWGLHFLALMSLLAWFYLPGIPNCICSPRPWKILFFQWILCESSNKKSSLSLDSYNVWSRTLWWHLFSTMYYNSVDMDWILMEYGGHSIQQSQKISQAHTWYRSLWTGDTDDTKMVQSWIRHNTKFQEVLGWWGRHFLKYLIWRGGKRGRGYCAS